MVLDALGVLRYSVSINVVKGRTVFPGRFQDAA